MTYLQWVTHVTRSVFSKDKLVINDPLVECWKHNKWRLPSRYLPSVVNTDACYQSFWKYNRPQPIPQRRAWAMSLVWLDRHFRPHIGGADLLPRDFVLREMNMDTSPGYPWNLTYHTKKLMLDDEKMMKVLEDYYEEIATVYPASVFPIWTCSVKGDELRPVEKILANKLRTFTASPFEHSCALNMLCLDMNNRFYRTAGKTWSFVGRSLFHGEWNDIGLKLETHPTKASVDGKNFDSSLFAEALWDLCKFRWSMLKPQYRTERTWRIMRNLYDAIINSVCVLDLGDLIRKFTGNPSGSANTIVDNTLLLIRFMFYAWLVLSERFRVLIGDLISEADDPFDEGHFQHRDMPDEAYDYSHMMRTVFMVGNGDDNTFSVADAVESWFNPVEISKVWQDDLGVEVTLEGSTKKALSAISFLSHWFVMVNGMWMPSPDTDKVLGSLYVGSKVDDIRWHLMRAYALRITSYMNEECRFKIETLINYMHENYADELIGTVNGVSMEQIHSMWMSDNDLVKLYTGQEGKEFGLKKLALLDFVDNDPILNNIQLQSSAFSEMAMQVHDAGNAEAIDRQLKEAHEKILHGLQPGEVHYDALPDRFKNRFNLGKLDFAYDAADAVRNTGKLLFDDPFANEHAGKHINFQPHPTKSEIEKFAISLDPYMKVRLDARDKAKSQQHVDEIKPVAPRTEPKHSDSPTHESSQLSGTHGSWTRDDDQNKKKKNQKKGNPPKARAPQPSKPAKAKLPKAVKAAAKAEKMEEVKARHYGTFLRNPAPPPPRIGSSGETPTKLIHGFYKLTQKMDDIKVGSGAGSLGTATSLVVFANPRMFNMWSNGTNYNAPFVIGFAKTNNDAFDGAGTIASLYTGDFVNASAMKAEVNGATTSTESVAPSRWLGAAVSIDCRCPTSTTSAPFLYGGLLPSNVGSPTDPSIINNAAQLSTQKGNELEQLASSEEIPGLRGSSVYFPRSAADLNFNTIDAQNTAATLGQTVTAIPYIGMNGCPTTATVVITITSWWEIAQTRNNSYYGGWSLGPRISHEDVYDRLKRFKTVSTKVVNQGARQAAGTATSQIMENLQKRDPSYVPEKSLMEIIQEMKEELKQIKATRGDDLMDHECVGCQRITSSPGLCSECHVTLKQCQSTLDNNGVTSVDSTPDTVTRQLDALKLQLTGKVPAVRDLNRFGIAPKTALVSNSQ